MERKQQAALPTGAESRFWSNLGHWVEGGLFAIVGLLALLESSDILTDSWIYVWPTILLIAGLTLPLGIFGHGHGEDARASRAALLADPQQQQHLIIAGLLFVAGVAEIAALASGIGILRYVWPLVLIVIGILFMIHTQHGTSEAATKAVRVHRILGGTLLLAGLARGLAVASGTYTGVLGLAWVVLLLITAVQLLIFREPEGAYEGDGHNNHTA
jgi:hypothetical protein